MIPDTGYCICSNNYTSF